MEDVMVFGEPVPASDVKEFVRTLTKLSTRRSLDSLDAALDYLVDWGIDTQDNLETLLDELAPAIEVFFGADAVERLRSFFFKLEEHFEDWIYKGYANKPSMYHYTGPDYYRGGSSRRRRRRRGVYEGDWRTDLRQMMTMRAGMAFREVADLVRNTLDQLEPQSQFELDEVLGYAEAEAGRVMHSEFSTLARSLSKRYGF